MINTQYHYLLIHIKKCIAAKCNSYKSTNQCINLKLKESEVQNDAKHL